jgi:hypothetical protein
VCSTAPITVNAVLIWKCKEEVECSLLSNRTSGPRDKACLLLVPLPFRHSALH